MAITNADIKLFQSQDNTDNDSGGGSRTSSEVVDGAVNNLFPDISRIDTVSGDVALRKVFPVVTTNNREIYYGAHTMLRKTPTDPNVSGLIFYTDSPTDKRSEAQDKIEAYVVPAYEASFYLYGTHIKGAKAVTWLQRETELLPDVGDVYLIKENSLEQYVRVVAIETAIIKLSYTVGGTPVDYDRRRIIATIDQPLTEDFTGSTFDPAGQTSGSADTFTTQVANASKFYSTKSLSVIGSTGDTNIKVDSIFEQLVPASKQQTPLIDKQALSQGDLYIDGVDYFNNGYFAFNTGNPVFVADYPITPGTFRGSSNTTNPESSVSFIDLNGDGVLSSMSGNTIYGTIDYEQGIVTWTSTTSYSSQYMWYKPMNKIQATIEYSGGVKITQENQGLVFVKNMSPLPSLPNFYVDYRSNGKWYRINANRDGTMGNDGTIGIGNLNDNGDGTGTVSITLGALPDLDSSVIFSWGTVDDTLPRTTDIVAAEKSLVMEIPLGQTNIDPTTFVMQAYDPNYSTVSNITADAAGNLIDAASNGTITGSLDVLNGVVRIINYSRSNRFDSPASGRNVIIDFDYSDASGGADGTIVDVVASANVGHDILFTAQDHDAGTLSFPLGQAVTRQTVTMDIKLIGYTGNSGIQVPASTLRLESDASGVLRKANRRFDDTSTYGTISATGDVDIQLPSYSYHSMVGVVFGGDYLGTGNTFSTVTKYRRTYSVINVKYQINTPATHTLSHNITAPMESIATYKVTMPPYIVGEVIFSLGTQVLNSKSGNLFNAGGSQIGTIDYTEGEASVSYFHDPDQFEYEFTQIITGEYAVINDKIIKSSTFKTSATKLTTSSFQLRYTTENGSYNATTDNAGVITGTDIDGVNSYVDTETGMAYIVFNALTDPASIKYDAVAETSLPLDPDLLGLNPVRLPSDGRVPVFDAGRHLVIFHEANTSAGTPVADQVITLARDKQAYIEVVDVNGDRLAQTEYTADRDAGTVTFSNPLNFVDKYANTLTAPFTIVDRVEDMVLATDVQINGLISISAPLSREYPADDTRVASALVWGNIGARYYNLFSQAYFDVWSDDQTQDNTLGQYDDVNYPIQIDNNNSTAGRWSIVFSNSTTVDVVHEKLGVLLSDVNITTTNIAPLNPATANPYFTMLKEGFGAGWVTSNVIRFNTDSGGENMWLIRTVQSGQLTEETDNIEVELRGDAN